MVRKRSPVRTRLEAFIFKNEVSLHGLHHYLSRPLGQAVKTPPFHGGNTGSNPVGVTKLLNEDGNLRRRSEARKEHLL